jgi:hypothetical protein
LDSGVINKGDAIKFKFKKDSFEAVIADGGFIGRCTMNGTPVSFSGFKTLTDWCDSCIQELVHEYVTRFSSWKRVKHVPTGKSFTQLRDALSQARAGTPTHCQCAEGIVARRKILFLEQEVMQLRQQLEPRASLEPLPDDNPFKLIY